MNERSKKRLAIVSIAVQAYIALSHSFAYFQTAYQLTSPLIPVEVVKKVRYPHMVLSLTAIATLLLSLVLYVNKKRFIVFLIGPAMLVWEYVYTTFLIP